MGFNRSFITFCIDLAAKPAATMSDVPPFDLNKARIPVDCVMTVLEKASGRTERIFLGGNCKTETVGVSSEVWMAPNADFVPVYSAASGKALTIKTYDRVGRAVKYSSVTAKAGAVQSDRAVVSTAEAFSSLDLHLKRGRGRHLPTASEVVAAGLDGEPLFSRMYFGNDRYDVMLEYPFKTCNFNDRAVFFQPDTGPVIFPRSLDCEFDELIEQTQLAFVAWNRYPGSACGEPAPGWAEFILQRPVEISEGVFTQHYSQSVRIECQNEMYTLG